MMEHESTQTLMQVLCLLAATATFSWWVMAYPMRVAPKASIRFSLANFCVLIGMLLYTQRTGQPSYLYWFAADIIILLGFSILRWGSQRLDRLPSSTIFDLTVVTIAAFCMLLVPPERAEAVYLVSILSLAASVLFLGLARDHFHAFRDTFTALATYCLVIPIALIGGLFLLRTIILLIFPQQITVFATLNTADAKPTLWVYIILILLVNISIIGNSINKLVSKILTLANRDALTGIWNRHSLDQQLQRIHSGWKMSDTPYCILLLDLDHFKKINDNWGHAMGDVVLEKAANAIDNVIRNEDFFCRYGGEEFLLLLPNCTLQQAHKMALRCQQVLADLIIYAGEHKLTITASIGCAIVTPKTPIKHILVKADQAMYEAKKAGRNCIATAA
jgi:diguanylate cyclase (GGDEF)-like protein